MQEPDTLAYLLSLSALSGWHLAPASGIAIPRGSSANKICQAATEGGGATIASVVAAGAAGVEAIEGVKKGEGRIHHRPWHQTLRRRMMKPMGG